MTILLIVIDTFLGMLLGVFVALLILWLKRLALGDNAGAGQI